MSIENVLQRAVGIGHATVDQYARQREQIAADALNRLATEQRYVVACQDALLRLAELCYVQVGSRYVNIDNLTWRILINVPWSSSGCALYGLRYWEARTLANIIMARCSSRGAPLFDYGQRRWHLNATDYPNVESAIAYLDKRRLTVDEWLTFADARRESARNRITRYRGRQ